MTSVSPHQGGVCGQTETWTLEKYMGYQKKRTIATHDLPLTAWCFFSGWWWKLAPSSQPTGLQKQYACSYVVVNLYWSKQTTKKDTATLNSGAGSHWNGQVKLIMVFICSADPAEQEKVSLLFFHSLLCYWILHFLFALKRADLLEHSTVLYCIALNNPAFGKTGIPGVKVPGHKSYLEQFYRSRYISHHQQYIFPL